MAPAAPRLRLVGPPAPAAVGAAAAAAAAATPADTGLDTNNATMPTCQHPTFTVRH